MTKSKQWRGECAGCGRFVEQMYVAEDPKQLPAGTCPVMCLACFNALPVPVSVRGGYTQKSSATTYIVDGTKK